MSDKYLDELNFKWRVFKTKIEAELNKNSIGFGDLQPGNIYHIPIVTGFRTKFDGPALAGFTKEFFLKEDKANTPDLKFPVLIGYAFGSRISLFGEEYLERQMRCIIEEIKLSLKHASGITPEDPHYGYYIKLSDFVDVENYAAYEFTVESKVIPMVQLGRKREDVEL